MHACAFEGVGETQTSLARRVPLSGQTAAGGLAESLCDNNSNQDPMQSSGMIYLPLGRRVPSNPPSRGEKALATAMTHMAGGRAHDGRIGGEGIVAGAYGVSSLGL